MEYRQQLCCRFVMSGDLVACRGEHTGNAGMLTTPSSVALPRKG
jgi:hypothetical protein